MSRDWNGLSIQTECSNFLSDTTTAFKAKVLGWMNDIQQQICSYHKWGFLKHKGKKLLASGAEVYSLQIAPPTAPTVAIAAGGSLVDGTSYYVVVTFYESVSGAESIAGTTSAAATATSVNKTINVTAIPVSTDPLVTQRKIYLQIGTAEPIYNSTITDNTTTSTTISTTPTSTIEPPDYHCIDELIGNPFFESTPSIRLARRDEDQMRLLFEGAWSSGSPSFFSSFGENRIQLYPIPSSSLTLSFYYKKTPTRLYAEATSYPEIPYKLKNVLVAGVVWRGYDYRDRDGKVSMRNEYFELLRESVSRFGNPNKGPITVRDVVGNSDGHEITGG